MIYALIIISAAIIATVLVLYMRERGAAAMLRRQLDRASADLDARTAELTEAKEVAARAEADAQTIRLDNVRLQERLRNLEEDSDRRQREEQTRFKAMAAEVLEATGRQMREHQQAGLDAILAPLRENISKFEHTVTECYGTEARERFSLHRTIEQLIQTNDSIGREARELAKALRGDSKVQGDWGEMILESILEKSGLRRDEEFIVQATRDLEGNILKNESGSLLRPDVIVKYPGDRCLVIDSKVSLTAYTELVNAETDQARDEAADRHLRSVRQHVRELRDKRYQDYLGGATPDFVLMFIPNEGAYIAAMQGSSTLWQEAYDNRVLIVSPTHLVSALRMVQQLWVQDRQSRNVVRIAQEAGALYDKFAGFLTDMDKINRSITAASTAYTTALGKLSSGRGNIMTRIEHLKELGAKASKSLPVSATDTDPS